MVRNDINISFFGIRRGGQHAIINWIAAHFNEPIWFLNNMTDFGNPKPIPDDTGETALPCFVDNPRFVKGMWKIPKAVLFQSYEDKPIGKLDFAGNEQAVGRSRIRKHIVILRDPFNTLASRMNQGNPVFHITPKLIKVWKQLAFEALGGTSFLLGCVFISYNQWFKSPEYRRRLERILGLPCSDKALETVSGVGSSFSRREMDGRAQQMKIEDRWQSCCGNPAYQMLMQDQELWVLSDQLFGKGIAEPLRPKISYTVGSLGILKGKRLAYIRTPKTASTTLKDILQARAKIDGKKVLYKYHSSIHQCREKYDWSLHHVVFNRVNMEALRRLLPNCHFFTSVRDPLNRARSHYHHIGPHGNVNKFAEAGVSFPEWYMMHKDDEGDMAGWKNSILLRHWTNGVIGGYMGFPNPGVTYNEFADRFVYCSVAEKFDLSLKVLGLLLDVPLEVAESRRVATYDRGEIPKEVEEMFREKNAVDYQLYGYGCRRLEEQARELHCE